MDVFFFFEAHYPSGNFSLASYFPLKVLPFETPHPLGISCDHPRGGYGYFLELHIAEFGSYFDL